VERFIIREREREILSLSLQIGMSDLKSIDLQLPSTCVQFKVPEFSPLLQACFSNLLSVKTEVTDAVGFYREGTGAVIFRSSNKIIWPCSVLFRIFVHISTSRSISRKPRLSSCCS